MEQIKLTLLIMFASVSLFLWARSRFAILSSRNPDPVLFPAKEMALGLAAFAVCSVLLNTIKNLPDWAAFALIAGLLVSLGFVLATLIKAMINGGFSR